MAQDYNVFKIYERQKIGRIERAIVGSTLEAHIYVHNNKKDGGETTVKQFRSKVISR